MDWGSAKPFSVGWWAVVGDDHRVEGQVLPRGAILRYREWYGSTGKPNEGLKLTAEQVAEGIRDRELGDTVPGGVLDPAAFAEDGGPSIAERMRRCKVSFRPADNKRVPGVGSMGGWDQMRQRINGPRDEQGEPTGEPMLYVFSTCRDFIRTVPVLQHDPNRPEDLDTDGEDHVADECRYACMSRPMAKPSVILNPNPTDLWGKRKKVANGWKTS
jgi:hypothetical protein